MTTTAKSLLSHWITVATKKELTATELELRQATITRLLGNNQLPYWVGLIKLFSGFSKEDATEATALISEFFKDDQTFPLANNAQLIRALAGCMIARKIESDSSLSNTLMLSTLTINFPKGKAELSVPAILTRVEELWQAKCITNRDLPSVSKITPLKIPSAITKVALTTEPNSSVNDKVQAHLNTLFTDSRSQQQLLNKIASFLTDIEQRVLSNSEETNILSWILNSYSRGISASFSDIGATKLSFIGAKDLADLTTIPPGLSIAHGALNKMLELSGNAVPHVSLATIVDELNRDSPYTDWVAQILKSPLIPAGESITPLLYALHCYKEHDQESDWKSSFKRKSNFSADDEAPLLDFAMQFYKECMLLAHSNS